MSTSPHVQGYFLNLLNSFPIFSLDPLEWVQLCLLFMEQVERLGCFLQGVSENGGCCEYDVAA